MARFNPFRLWFNLTAAEQRLVLTILTLTVLGLGARYLYLQRPSSSPTPPTVQHERP